MKKKMLCMLLAFTLLLPVAPVSAKAKPILNKTSIAISKGKTYKLKLKNNKKKVKWSSSNKKIATVSKKGIIKGKSNGYAKITAKVGKKKYTCKVYVGKCLYSNKYISIYYLNIYSAKSRFAIYNKTNQKMEILLSTLSLDSQNFYGGGWNVIKKKTVTTVDFDSYTDYDVSMKKKTHKYLSLSGSYFTSKIDKDFLLHNKVIGNTKNYTGVTHSKNVLINNSKIKISYSKQTEEGLLFTVTNNSSKPITLTAQYLIIDGHSFKEQELSTFAPKSTGQTVFEGNIQSSKTQKMSGAFEINYEYNYSFLDKTILY